MRELKDTYFKGIGQGEEPIYDKISKVDSIAKSICLEKSKLLKAAKVNISCEAAHEVSPDMLGKKAVDEARAGARRKEYSNVNFPTKVNKMLADA